ncbi:MAG TPA: adenine phosphoribosyltransferase [Polyangiaceae bacterium]|jgi:adenine phosphoribosyltransferase|nr:adenine phosphoribosyltransferase [Polyangiaceae bacterium]
MAQPARKVPTKVPNKIPTKVPTKAHPKTAPSKLKTPRSKATTSLSVHVTAKDFEPLGYAKSLIRAIPDFPIPGILFRDITPVLANARAFHAVIDAFVSRFIGEGLDAIVAIESRGFIFGAALAARLNVSFVPVRRPGKLPAATDRVEYSLEYGVAKLEMHKDALPRGARVIVIDDLLATGGTAQATGKLVAKRGAEVVAYAFVIELDALNGRRVFNGVPVVSLIHF